MTDLQFVFRSHENTPLHNLITVLILQKLQRASLCCCLCHNHCLSLSQLEVRKSQNEAVCKRLRAQIRELWDRLQIPEEEREAVVAMVMTGSKAKVQKAVGNP